MTYLWCTLFLCVFIHLSQAWPTGAPDSVCESMTPGHGTESTEANPYSLMVTTTEYTPGTPVTVTVSGGTFAGILIQARKKDKSMTTPIGTFSDPGAASNLKLLTCTTAGSSITHSATTGKMDVELTWNPPADDQGEIEFIATVAREKTAWWKNTKAGSLMYRAAPTQPDGGATSEPSAEPTSEPTTPDGDTNTGYSAMINRQTWALVVCTILLLAAGRVL